MLDNLFSQIIIIIIIIKFWILSGSSSLQTYINQKHIIFR